MKGTKLSDESYLFVGAGEAGVGIADLLVAALKAEGLDEATARRKVFLFDTKGLITAGRGDAATMQHHKKPYAHDFQPAVVSDLLECVKLLKPSALIGVSTNSDCFTEDIIKLMTAMNGRPIIFPLSNPTRKSECTFAAAVQHSDGKARQTIHFARPTSVPFRPPLLTPYLFFRSCSPRAPPSTTTLTVASLCAPRRPTTPTYSLVPLPFPLYFVS